MGWAAAFGDGEWAAALVQVSDGALVQTSDGALVQVSDGALVQVWDTVWTDSIAGE